MIHQIWVLDTGYRNDLAGFGYWILDTGMNWPAQKVGWGGTLLLCWPTEKWGGGGTL